MGSISDVTTRLVGGEPAGDSQHKNSQNSEQAKEREPGLRGQLHWVLKERQLNLFEAEEIIKLEKILPIQICRRNMKLIKLCLTIVLLGNFIDAAPLELASKVSSVFEEI